MKNIKAIIIFFGEQEETYAKMLLPIVPGVFSDGQY